MERLIAPIVFIIIGVSFLISTFFLTSSSVGNPNELKYFPTLISIVIIFFSIIYFIREWKLRDVEFSSFNKLKVPKTIKRLGITVLLMIAYTLVLEFLGFLISTVLFLGALLFLLNGKIKWKSNIIIAVLFTFVTWYSFGTLLQVGLP